MADQPSITSILAALAAQRPAANPAPIPPPTYQQPPPQQQNPYPGYSLPQPTSSGSVDLSNIKPVNSGSVDFMDAVAKAKVIAAEKRASYRAPPIPYGSQDLRGAPGRPYDSRSRSRSPVRRDGNRDSFNSNPYRDERRGGAPGRDYRERSFSPGPRGRQAGAFSPVQGGGGGYGQRDRSPPRGADEAESISIESNLVGLIIGRQGENLRRVESETGCRVQFITGPDENGPYRQCKITGSRANRAKAKAEITRIIDDSGMAANARAAAERQLREPAPPGPPGPPGRASSHQPALRDGEDTMQIMVPDRTVGLIIGRGGETIRDLQERSGCHVNIVGEQKSVNGLRPVNLIGSREAAARAKDLIMEIVESDSKGTATKERAPAPTNNGRDGGFGANHGGGTAGVDKITDAIYVPSDAVGMIIGKGGETIKDMQATTNCKINVTPSSGPGEKEREIGLVGSREAIAAAKRAIGDKVDAVAQKSLNGGGGRNRAPQNDNNDRNYNQNSSYGQSQPSGQAAPPAAADPYAAYGGYEAYVALWYQAMAQQQQAGAGQGDAPKPPGTS